MATGNRFGNLFGLTRWLRREIPEGDYFARIILDTRPAGYASLTKNRSGRFFVATLARGRNISFKDDGLRGENAGEI